MVRATDDPKRYRDSVSGNLGLAWIICNRSSLSWIEVVFLNVKLPDTRVPSETLLFILAGSMIAIYWRHCGVINSLSPSG